MISVLSRITLLDWFPSVSGAFAERSELTCPSMQSL